MGLGFDVGDDVQWRNMDGQTERGIVIAIKRDRVDVRMTTIGGIPRAKPTEVFFERDEIPRLSRGGG